MARSVIGSIMKDKSLDATKVFNDVTILTGEHDQSVSAEEFWGKRSYNSKIKWFNDAFLGCMDTHKKPSKTDKFVLNLFDYLGMSEADIERFWIERKAIIDMKAASKDIKDAAGLEEIQNEVFDNLDDYVEKARIHAQQEAERKAREAAEKANKPKRVRKSKDKNILAEALSEGQVGLGDASSANSDIIDSVKIDDALGF